MINRQTLYHRSLAQLIVIGCLLIVIPFTFAQSGNREARIAQWDGYQIPTGEFIRFIDRQKGYSLWHPIDWKEHTAPNGDRFFRPAPHGVNLLVFTDDIPDGLGIANYVSGVLQGLRVQPVKQDTLTVRRVMLGGLEWREVTHELEARGGRPIRQTMWLAVVGPRAYGFVLSLQAEEAAQYEPILKRILISIRIGAAGHWNEEFENLRAQFTVPGKPVAGREIEAAMIAEAFQSGRESLQSSIDRMIAFFERAPDAALDLMTDADPLVRTAAVTALGKRKNVGRELRDVDVLIWALTDKDIYASTAAAQALSSLSTVALPRFKSRLAALAENPAVIVRAGVAFGEVFSRELIEELLRSDSNWQHLAALQLALALQDFKLQLPLAKLLASNDPGVLHATIGVLSRYHPTEAVPELIKLLRSDTEMWAARVLGEVAPVEIAQTLIDRITEIDARLDTLVGGDKKITTSRKGRNRTPVKRGDLGVTPVELVTSVDLKAKSEEVRLAFLRGEIDMAARKIRFRDRWKKAKDEDERRAITSEISKGHSDLIGWSRVSLSHINDAAPPTPSFDLTQLKDAPTTGETLFPKETFSYVMSPNFAQTMEKLDMALSGVQMATVRDQMTFALILKLLKANLAAKLGVDATGDVSKAIGIDLKSPIALASWANEKRQEDGVSRSAIVARVTDRTRFERVLALYQEEFGSFDSFFTATAVMSRFAGVIPAAVPVVFASIASNESRGLITKRVRSSNRPAIPSLQPITWIRQEKINDLTVTILNRPVFSESGSITSDAIYLAYLGDTAIVAQTKSALVDLLKTAIAQRPSIAQGDAFAKARSQAGEIIFFSRLTSMLRPLLEIAETAEETDQVAAFLKAFSIETGSLQLTPTSWETSFNIGLADSEFIKSFIPFKANTLVAPRELLPNSTILYAGAVIDPPKMMNVLKSLKRSGSKPEAAADSKRVYQRGKELDEDIEKLIVPNMQGEIAGALVSLEPLFSNDNRSGSGWPAMVLALKLKNKDLAEALRAKKLLGSFPRISNATALGSPIVALGDEESYPFLAVTDDYLIITDGVETLRLLEAKEKFSSARDFVRSANAVPDNLIIFATYNLDAAFDQSAKAINDSSSQQMMPFVSAVIHAFHSQRAYVTIEKEGENKLLKGRLAVAFDRDGRYSVGELANRSGEFDVANAMITPRGLNIVGSSRVESITLRVTAKQAGVAPRLREDVSKFNWQHIESGDDTTVVFTSTARRITENQTIQLPMTAVEFAPFINPTARINSRDPRIVELAKQIAGEEKDGRRVARKLGEWTFSNLKWKKVQNDTIETLASREADCLEHSELYVALARSLGLPARVVSGAALSGGAFGAHAWVEVYLGKWIEIDPTWGLMDYVDATHLRFDGDTFITYAMLNQIDLEITSASNMIADYQRDPVRLVKEFSSDPEKRNSAFDFVLTVENALGPGAWDKLDEKQRAAVLKAYERTVKEVLEEWSPDITGQVRVLKSEIKGNRATVTVLRDVELIRLSLASRDGAWFITEHEVVDDALPEFGDAIQGALHPGTWRGQIYELPAERALDYINNLISTQGESPQLLLLKYRMLVSQQQEDRQSKAVEMLKAAQGGKGKPGDPQLKKQAQELLQDDQATELLQQIIRRWPDFAPAHLALAFDLLYNGNDDSILNGISKDVERSVAPLRRYIELVPYDPRPWRDLAYAYELLEKEAEAEAAYHGAIERDPTFLEHYAKLITFLLSNDHLEKAKTTLRQMLKVAPSADDAFDELYDEEGYDPDYAKMLESLLTAFPKELAASKSGMVLLANLQESQNRTAEAVKTMQRAVTIKAEADDYEYLSRLFREQQRFNEALNAANQALKIDEKFTAAYFERACSLTQLGRKREALAALKLMIELDPEAVFDPDEPDLQPLANLPEFKALKEKMKEPAVTPEGTKPEQTQPEKGEKAKTGKP